MHHFTFNWSYSETTKTSAPIRSKSIAVCNTVQYDRIPSYVQARSAITDSISILPTITIQHKNPLHLLGTTKLINLGPSSSSRSIYYTHSIASVSLWFSFLSWNWGKGATDLDIRVIKGFPMLRTTESSSCTSDRFQFNSTYMQYIVLIIPGPIQRISSVWQAGFSS